ncbi:MAG: DUF3572 family protein [Hyphomicrobiales bacterium]
MTRDDADMIAIRGLQHISADEALLQRFVDLSGLDISDIRTAASSPHFLLAVLEFLRQDESECSMFASNLGLSAHDVESAIHFLSPTQMDDSRF